MSYSPRYYDRAGAPISMERWGELLEDFEYRVVAKESLALGDDRVEVSTVWLGLDHSFLGGRPVIFETMVFGGPHDGDCERYCTEAQAREGHERVVDALVAERDDTLEMP